MFPKPTDAQLDLINKFTAAQIQAEEVVVVSFVGTDNLLNRSLGKWGINELEKLAGLLPGLPLTLDHDWVNVSKVQGLAFDARVTISPNPPEWVSRSASYTWNMAIIAKEGYRALEFDVSIPANAEILIPLRFGSIGKISLGGFAYKNIICPLCNVPFDDQRCPHLIPDNFTSNELNAAPYYIRSDVIDLGEASIVTIPNYIGTGTKKTS